MKKTLFTALAAMMFLSVSSHAQEEGLITDSTSIFSVVEVLDEALMTAEKSRVVYRLDRPKYPNIVFSLTYSFNAEGQHKDKGGAVSSGALFEGKDF